MNTRKKIVDATLILGKIAYCGNRKVNEVELSVSINEVTVAPFNPLSWNHCRQDLELNTLDTYYTFTASAAIWQQRRGDCLACGQLVEEAVSYFPNDARAQRICEIWKRWHLNDLHAGTTAQMKAVKDWEAKGNKYDYTKACEYLKSIALYEDRGYKYGCGLLVEPLPLEIVQEVKELVKEFNKIS